MNDKERAAMQQALEALEQYHYTLISAGVLDKQHVLNQGFTAHAALREALEQPKFTPEQKDRFAAAFDEVFAKAGLPQQPVRQDPVAWMHKCGDVCSAYDKEHMFGLDYFNIPLYAAPVESVKQEPVAWRWPTHNGYAYAETHFDDEGGEPLYAAPVRTKDLTKPEMLTRAVAAGFMLHTGYGQSVNKMMPVSDSATLVEFARAVIAADRELNK